MPLYVALITVANAQPLDQHYQAAQDALAHSDTARAKRELKLSLQDDPLHAEAHFLLASLLAEAGDLDQAAVGYQETVKLDPNNATARYNLGTILLLRGEVVLAASQLEDALALRPDSVPTYNNLAKAYFVAGLPEYSVASYQEALRRDPQNATARKGLAVLTADSSAEDRPARDRGNAARPPANTAPPTAAAPGKERPAVLVEAPSPVTPHLADAEGTEARALQELIRDLPHVTVERRGGHLTLGGWTSGTGERKLLDRIIAAEPSVLDLTSDDVGDPHQLLEVDAVLFIVSGIDSQSAGHDFLRRVTVNASVSDVATAGFDWLYSAAISYEVNIANATDERLALLARPHLSTLSGSAATFVAGGDTVYKVTGNVGGDVKTYPFGTTLEVTPTLLRTRASDGTPRVRLLVKAGRKTILLLDSPEVQSTGASVYANVSVTSEAVLDMNQTLILTGLSQRERTISRSGVPGLMHVPLIKYLVSERKTITKDMAIVILLTPRDPAYWDEKNQQALTTFVEKRRAYMEAIRGTPEDMRRFKERYPDWMKIAPNRFASHFFLMENSELYRQARGIDLDSDALDLDFDLLGKVSEKGKPKK